MPNLNSDSNLDLIAACAFGLETPVKWELQQLGYEPSIGKPGRVHFVGDWRDVCRTNLWLRVADRVLVRVASVPAADFDALFESIKALDWSELIPASGRFPVTARSKQSQLTSVPAIQRSSKKAIVESMMRGHATNVLPEDGPEFRIDVALQDNVAEITIDSSGASLHKRGYRREYGVAPLKETLAAALVMLSVWDARRPLVDPFCGSGTIPIEAAMIARNQAPGLERRFNCFDWPQINHAVIEELKEQANQAIEPDIELQISGTDIDTEVLQNARSNAQRAGLAECIHFQCKPFDQLRSKREFGCIIANPPYGQRLGIERELLDLYRSFPAILQRLPTWSHFILTNIPRFEGLIQNSATRRRKLFNGRIECSYYQFLGPKPMHLQRSKASEIVDEESQIEIAHSSSSNENAGLIAHSQTTASDKEAPRVEPVFGGLTEKDRQQAELFATRLRKRARHLRRWPTRRGITCFRIYDRDIPELPFVVDRYEDHFHVTEFERPHDRDPGRQGAWQELMTKTVAATFEVPIHHVHTKYRQRQSGSGQHPRQSVSGQTMTVNEGGLKFLVNLSDYVDTGLFLDHRETRAMVQSESANRRVLNLFAYTGSFSVYAAAGGATSTTTVDWSRTYLNWSRENMRLNGFTGSQHQFHQEDALEFLDRISAKTQFDLAIVDPPTFSNSKRTEKIWDVQKHHGQLLNILSKQMLPGGVVYFSTNFRRFKFDETAIPGFDAIEISAQTVPEDFRSRRIHRCWKLKRK